MNDLSRASGLAILSAMILGTALAGCKGEPPLTVTIPRSSFEAMLGHQPAQVIDTNFIARMEFNAAQLQREILQNSNNWGAMRAILQQIDQRLQALEPKPVPAPPVIPPLQSAPVLPPIEKEKAP